MKAQDFNIACSVNTLTLSYRNALFHISEKIGGGWMYLYSFICLSARAVEWESSCIATTLLLHAPPMVTSVLVLFVIFGGLF